MPRHGNKATTGQTDSENLNAQGSTANVCDSRRRHGSAADTLLDHNLIDDIRIWVYPIVVGEGERLFDHPVGKTLELADNTTFDTGVVVLCYKPTRSPQDGSAAGGSH